MTDVISVETLNKMQSGMFHTYTTIDELMDALSVKGNDVVLVMCAFNTALAIAAKNCKELQLEQIEPIEVGDEFEDSLEATEFMDDLSSKLEDPRLLDWAKSTDENYGKHSVLRLEQAREAFGEFMDQMYEADED